MLFENSLRYKIILSLGIILVVGLCCVSIAEYTLTFHSFRESVEGKARAVSSALTKINVIEHEPSFFTAFIGAVFEQKAKEEDVLYVFQDIENQEVFLSNKEFLLGKLDQDVVKDFFSNDLEAFTFEDHARSAWTKNKDFIYTSAPFIVKQEGNERLVRFVLFVKASVLWQRSFQEYSELIFSMSSIFLVLVLVIFFQLREYFIIPLEKISEVISKRLAGDVSILVPVSGKDEISVIGNALNKLLLELSGTLKSLAKNQEKYELAVTGASISIWSWDLSEDHIHWAGHSNLLFGTIDNESLPKNSQPLFSRMHREDVKAFRENIDVSIEMGTPINLDVRIKNYSGKYIWVSTRGQVTVDSEGLKKATGIFYDITQQKITENHLAKAKEESERALEALQESENRLALAVETTTDGLWEWNLVTDKVHFSQRLLTLLGYRKSDTSFPSTFSELRERVHPEDREHLDREIEKHIERGDSFSIEYRMKDKQGAYRFFRLKGGAQKDENGRVIRIAGSNTDVAKEKENEIILQQYANDLEEAFQHAENATRAKSEFLANMSHEIRTPLNGIIGTVSLLEKTELSKSQTKYVDTISESGDMLLHILNDVLDYSKIEAGKMELSFKPFKLCNVLKSVRALYLSQARAKEIDILIEEDNEVPHIVVGDKVRIRQIITNLVSNAVKYTEQGYIRIKISVPKYRDNDFTFRCEVEDTGVGIDEALQQHIFKKFIQAETSNEQMRGTGLGLSICHSLVGLMNGQIGVQSTEGKGSSFWFEIPLFYASKEDMSLENESMQEDSAYFPVDILLVEDVPTNQFIISNILEQLGCSVTLASNGEEALKYLDEQSFPLVFMDCSMPILDGLKATELWRETERKEKRKKTPIIALTAHAFEEEKENCFSVGMDDFVSKPVKYEDLLATLKKWLTLKQRKSAMDAIKGINKVTDTIDIDVDLTESDTDS